MRPSNIDTLARAMAILAHDIYSPDGVASAAILEAGQRLEQIAADLRVVLPYLVAEAGSAKPGRKARAAFQRLSAEVAK